MMLGCQSFWIRLPRKEHHWFPIDIPGYLVALQQNGGFCLLICTMKTHQLVIEAKKVLPIMEWVFQHWGRSKQTEKCTQPKHQHNLCTQVQDPKHSTMKAGRGEHSHIHVLVLTILISAIKNPRGVSLWCRCISATISSNWAWFLRLGSLRLLEEHSIKADVHDCACSLRNNLYSTLCVTWHKACSVAFQLYLLSTQLYIWFLAQIDEFKVRLTLVNSWSLSCIWNELSLSSILAYRLFCAAYSVQRKGCLPWAVFTVVNLQSSLMIVWKVNFTTCSCTIVVPGIVMFSTNPVVWVTSCVFGGSRHSQYCAWNVMIFSVQVRATSSVDNPRLSAVSERFSEQFMW